MRSHLVVTATLLAVFCAGTAQAQTRDLPVCKTRDAAQMAMQAGAAATLPEECRRVTVRSITTPTGPICVIDMSQDNTGVVGAMREAMATTEWWTACANLRAP